jgi:tetratricopeptide (TPR) repeat protein
MLARVLGATSRVKEASTEMEKVIAAAKVHFGNDAIEIGFFENAQAKYLLAAGALARAEQVQADVVRIMSTPPAEGGINLAIGRIGLAAIVMARRDAARALELAAEPAAQLAAALPAGHPFVIRAHLVLAQAHGRLGHHEQADRELAAIPAKIEDTSLTARVAGTRSTLAGLRGDHVGAEKWARAAVEAATGPSAAVDRLQSLPVLALALLGAHKFDEASTTAAQALDLSAELQSEDSPERADAWFALGGIAAARGDCPRAREHFAKAAAYWKRLPWTPDSARSAVQLCSAKAPS